MIFSRRTMLGTTAVGLAAAAAANAQPTNAQQPTGDIPQPERQGVGGTDVGPRNIMLDRQNPDLLVPPPTDHGTVPNLRFSFSNAPMRLQPGGWTRQVTVRELPISKPIAGVDMRLNAGGVREMHWHKASEWAYMINGKCRITAIDPQGRYFVDDVGTGDLWFFPSGVPHSLQGLDPDGCEFLLVFDDGEFSEDNTFQISDWFKHTPPAVLAKNFGVPAQAFANIPDPSQRYIFPLPVPGPLANDRFPGASPVAQTFSHKLLAQEPIRTRGGSVRIVDSTNFPVATTTAAALVEVLPGGMREMHWHPNADEWQYYLEGTARMGVFASSGDNRTFDFTAGDVGFVPFAMGHYIENTGSTPLRFLEMFKSSTYADVSLDQWMALTPPEMVRGTLNLDADTIGKLRKNKVPVVPA